LVLKERVLVSFLSPNNKIWDLAIVGAGPVGLEAAALARESGFATVVIEAGSVGANVARWGSVELFTPFGLNAGPAGLRALGDDTPRDSEVHTGKQFIAGYLIPLSNAIEDSVEILEDTRVVTVSREYWLKGEALGSDLRANQPFRLLVETEGRERDILARRVLDCSGTYTQPNWAGPGGTPARGERALRTSIEYHLPDLLGADRDRFVGVRTLLLGGGHSAGTAALALAELADGDDTTRFTWGTRSDRPQMLEPIADDPLPRRAALAERSRALENVLPEGCERLGGVQFVGIAKVDGRFRVEIDQDGQSRVEHFDRVLALVGYEPDDSLYRQLQIHECYASRGPMKLATALLGAGATGAADCLADVGFGPTALLNPEPDFFILGIKSYGKNSQFLMRTGYEQVADVFELFAVPVAT